MTSPKFLVIRRDNIGDLVCTTPLIHSLRTHFPDAEICALVNSYNVEVLKNNPDIDATYSYTKAKHRSPGQSVLGVYWDRLQLFRELRRKHFDYAILAAPHFVHRALNLARIVRPSHIIGFTEEGDTASRRIDKGIPYTSVRPLHEVEDVYRLLAQLGIDDAPPKLMLRAAEDEINEAQRRLAEHHLLQRLLIGIHISARKPSQRWPAAYFIDLIKQLYQRHGSSFMLLWSPGDESNPRHPGDDTKARQIMAALPEMPILAYPTNRLGQLLGGLSVCDAVVCSDGGAMHMAAGLGKPILCFFGKSDAARWHPWDVPYILLQPPSLDVTDISVEEALAGFEKLLAEGKQSRALELRG